MNSPAEKQQESEAPEAQDMSVEEQLSAEFDRMEAESEGETEHEEIETTAEAEETETEETEAEEKTSVEEEEAQAVEEQQEAEESGYTEPAPERWPDEMKEVYNKLPPEARQLMMEQVYKPMQRTYTQTTQELAARQKALNPMLQSLDQYRNDFERMGVQPEEAFRTQVAWAAHFARVGPQQGIADMQAAYGMDTKPAGQEVEEYLTPVERSLKADLNELKQQLGQTSQAQQGFVQQQQQQQQIAHAQAVQSELQGFINEQKDGKPAHPHVEKVAPAIAGIIRGGLINRTDDYGQPVSIRDQMAQAYEMACRLDPSINTATPGKKQSARAIAAQESSVVSTGTDDDNENRGQLTVEQQLEQEYDRLNRRVG
jgi:hypothetical protein